MTQQQIGGHRKVAHVVICGVAVSLIAAIWVAVTAIAVCNRCFVF